MRLHARHGVIPQEQTVGNIFEVSASVVLDADLRALALTPSLDTTANYARIAEIIREKMATPTPLLETVAARIALAIREEWPHALRGSVTIAKLTPPIPRTEMDRASVSVEF